MKFTILFQSGAPCEKKSDNINLLINELIAKIDFLHNLQVDDIISFFDTAANKLNKIFRKDFGYGHLLDSMKKENLRLMLDTALRKRQALNGFVKLGESKTLYHAQPRGLAVHWLAGNVPTLGLFSIFEALLTKNVSLVKASSREYKGLIRFLEALGKLKTKGIKGPEILKTIAVVMVDNSDAETLKKMSKAADIRIAWGGQETMDFITGLGKKLSAVDILHGPKYSYALIGKEGLAGDVKKLAQKLAVDVCVFDQYACSSPHTVFVEKGGRISPKAFAKELANGLALVTRMLLPKGDTDSGKVMDILNVRAKYEFSGEVFSSENTDWSVIYSEEKGLAEPCFSRVIFVRPVSDVQEIAKLNDRNKQTLGLSMSKERRLEFADKATVFGVDRCPPIGEMSFFESPWDGGFDLDKMVRWVTCYN